MSFAAKCSDCFVATYKNGAITIKDYDGYVPYNMGIGGGDYIEAIYCLDCGQIQGKFPIEEPG